MHRKKKLQIGRETVRILVDLDRVNGGCDLTTDTTPDPRKAGGVLGKAALTLLVLLGVAGCAIDVPDDPVTSSASQAATNVYCGIPPVQCWPYGQPNADLFCADACTGSDTGMAYCQDYTYSQYMHCVYVYSEIIDGVQICENGYPATPRYCITGARPATRPLGG